VIATASVDAEQLAELRRWLQAVDALTDAVNSTRSLAAILDLVANKARELLGFDFCAVLLPDPQRLNLVITGWSGLSAEYVARVNADRPVRLAVVGAEQAPSSKAFKTARPVCVTDIAAEPEFTPWGGVAREQGYRAMVSVPLTAGGAVVGTLNGYHAAVHHFTDYELQRLTLLANHAGIALTSARMVEEMHSLNESLRRQRDLLAKSEQIHQQLLAVALRGGGMAGIADVLSDLVSRPVVIEDAHGTVLAQTAGSTALPDDDALRSGPNGVDTVSPTAAIDSAGRGYVVWSVQLADEQVARVWLPGNVTDFSPIDERAVEHASIVISLEIVRRRTGIEVEHRLRGELLADILSGADPASASVRERAQRLGHDLSSPHAAIVGCLDTTGSRREATAYQRALNAVAELAAGNDPRPLVAMHRGQIVALWPLHPIDATGSEPEQRTQLLLAADRVRRAMAATPDNVGATVAVSDLGHQTYTQAYRIARGALRVAVQSGRLHTTVSMQDLGVSGLLLQLDDPRQLLEFADRTLHDVREHDRTRGTALLHTLRTYLDQDLHRSHTAQVLHVHPNTVTQRLQRIEILTALDLAQPSTVVQVKAALMLLDIAEGDEARSR
jgi:DNA-binding PucR family transcriptional regulator